MSETRRNSKDTSVRIAGMYRLEMKKVVECEFLRAHRSNERRTAEVERERERENVRYYNDGPLRATAASVKGSISRYHDTFVLDSCSRGVPSIRPSSCYFSTLYLRLASLPPTFVSSNSYLPHYTSRLFGLHLLSRNQRGTARRGGCLACNEKISTSVAFLNRIPVP